MCTYGCSIEVVRVVGSFGGFGQSVWKGCVEDAGLIGLGVIYVSVLW